MMNFMNNAKAKRNLENAERDYGFYTKLRKRAEEKGNTHDIEVFGNKAAEAAARIVDSQRMLGINVLVG